MRRLVSCILGILFLASLTAGADDFWVKKEWKTWSKPECKKMLEDSPWAKRVLVDNSSDSSQLPYSTGHASDTPGFGIANPGAGEISYFISLLSAPPIRMAFIRQQQIEQKFEKMSDAEKNAFNARMGLQFKGDKGDVIFIRVVFVATKPALGDAVTAYWQSFGTDSVPFGLYLVTEKGAKIQPMTFTLLKDSETGFDVTFPRYLGADPVIAPGAQTMKVQLPHPPVSEYPQKTITAEFRLDKMMWNGKLAY